MPNPCTVKKLITTKIVIGKQNMVVTKKKTMKNRMIMRKKTNMITKTIAMVHHNLTILMLKMKTKLKALKLEIKVIMNNI